VANQEKKDVYPFSFMVLIFLAAVIISSIAKQHTNSNAAWGTGACTIALMVAAKTRWELKGKWWFWAALCVGAAVQLPLVFLMPWAAPHLTGMGAMAFVIPGFLMALGCLFLAEKVFASSTRPG
jgi:peptidoglycan/LPS O-acetylase OafA/YrhL